MKQSPDKPKRFKIISRKALIRLTVLLLLFVITGCHMFSMPGKSYQGQDYQPKDPQLAAELEQHVSRLAGDIGTRNTFKPAHFEKLNEAADYIEKQFSTYGYKVLRQSFQTDHGKHTVHNLIAELTGSEAPSQIIVIGAHYDSAYFNPGANDNASGVAANLALAKRFTNNPQPKTIRFVAFVNEEPPHFLTPEMGSFVYAKQCHDNNDDIVAMFSLETIGYYTDQPKSQKYPAPFSLFYPSTGNFIAFVGNLGSSKLVKTSIASFRKHTQFPSEGAAVPAIVSGVGASDHWSFWQHDYKAIMLTDTAMFRYPHYHTQNDTPDRIDYPRMAVVVRGIEKVIIDLAAAN